MDRRSFLTGAAALGGLAALPAFAKQSAPRFPELSVSGSAGEIGRQVGQRFAQQIGSNVELYLAWLAEAVGVDKTRALRTTEGFVAVLERHAPELLEEIDGVALGSGRSLREIVMVNARTDMLVMAARPARDTNTADAAPGCTSMALTGTANGTPALALGQNWDWRPSFAGNTVILRIARPGAPRLVTVTEAGMVGKIGFNQHRLGVCLNFLSHPSESAQHPFGLPVHVLLRTVMECETIEQAVAKVAMAPRCASANFLIAQQGPDGPAAIDLEWTPDAIGRLTMREQTLLHTNHYLEPALAAARTAPLGTSTRNRLQVAQRLTAELRTTVTDPVERTKRILQDRTGAPYSLSRSPGAESGGQTLASVIMDLTHNRLWVAAGQPHLIPHVELPGV